MSEDILSVVTLFPDVASLAQGYMNRADGERLLLPLPEACHEGTGVRFVVYLSDGTPAFAGAGLCAQTSDQGGTVPAAQRFETLLDSLQFDERSRPVYDYIVAVRNAAYTQQPSAEEGVVADEVATGLEDNESQAYADESAPDDEPTQYMGAPSRPTEKLVNAGPTTLEVETFEIDASEDSAAGNSAAYAIAVSASIEPAPFQPTAEAVARMASFVPPPIPTGLLMRPARATHWQPAPPRRPTPRPSTGLFRYAAGTLPRPARAPRPDIDPSLRVTRPPRP